MQQTSRFDNSFWGTDPVNFTGFDNLCEIMKNGKHTCDDFQNFLKTRIQIEDTYAKSLIKLAKSTCEAPPVGTLHAAWTALRAETERIANHHLKLASELDAQVEAATKAFREKQREQRKKTEEVVKKAQKLRIASYEKNGKCKKAYELRSREHEKLLEEQQQVASAPKELEKVKQKIGKAEAAISLADQQYHEAVNQLEESRVLWEREMERCCAQFQAMEEERLTFLRDTLWLATNIMSSACVSDDEALETVRLALERVSVETDIAEYIREKRTGYDRPAKIEYEKYFSAASAAAAAAAAAQ
eukprot:m.8749 g.8749  ORF g.8749 m.8749 type:complete len:302 (+) comp2325_c0_seq1:143-1048(+)